MGDEKSPLLLISDYLKAIKDICGSGPHIKMRVKILKNVFHNVIMFTENQTIVHPNCYDCKFLFPTAKVDTTISYATLQSELLKEVVKMKILYSVCLLTSIDIFLEAAYKCFLTFLYKSF